jgi:hypothetical protein
MSNVAPVAGPGGFAKRTDRGLVERIQRDAKIQNASNGSYGERKNLESLASGASTKQATPMPNTTQQPAMASVTPVDAFAPTQRPDEVVTTGAGGMSEGAGEEVLMTPVDAPDQLSVLVRAMYMANPTPQLRRMVEAFDEEGR